MIDPVSGEEKLFVFGGRYLSSWAPARTSLLHNSKHHPHIAKEGSSKYVYSNGMWLYEPVSRSWEDIGSGIDGVDASKQPPGRYSHTILYVEEQQRVFMTGGSAHSDRSASGSPYLDLWSFDLKDRAWINHLAPDTNEQLHHQLISSQLRAVESPTRRLPSHALAPLARSHFSLTLLRAGFSGHGSDSDNSSNLLAIVFGGKRIDANKPKSKSHKEVDSKSAASAELRSSPVFGTSRDSHLRYAASCGSATPWGMLASEAGDSSHSEKNDVWALVIRSRPNAAEPNSSMGASAEENGCISWTQISSGGCHAFDDGRCDIILLILCDDAMMFRGIDK